MVLGDNHIIRGGTAPNGLPLGAVWVRMGRFIGDGILIHQSLGPLRAAGLPLVAWAPPPLAELVQGSEAFSGVWPDGPERTRPLALRRLLQAHDSAGVLNLVRSSRGLLAAWLARLPVRVGWREGGGSLMATSSLAFPVRGHQLEGYRELLKLAWPGLPWIPSAPFRPRPEAMAEAARLRSAQGLGRPHVILALGGASDNKRLATGVWVDLIARLRARGVAHVLIGGAGKDEAQASAILAALPGVPSLVGQLPLSVSAALLAGAAAAVGNDSALCHLAAACGTPVVTVFGPTRPWATAPVGPRVTVLRVEGLPCLECDRGCWVPGHPCMTALPAARIEEALAPSLA